jgi:hypothetical protein
VFEIRHEIPFYFTHIMRNNLQRYEKPVNPVTDLPVKGLKAKVGEKVPDARRTGKARRATAPDGPSAERAMDGVAFGPRTRTYASKRSEEQRRRWDFIANRPITGPF